MSAKTKETPKLGRFHPLHHFMRLQKYAQNSPRSYGWRVGLASGGLLTAVVLLAALPAALSADSPLDLWPVYVVALLVVLVVPLVTAFFAPRMTRWLTRGVRIPEDTDPERLWAAQRLLRRGELGSDPEVNRLARLLSAQAERGNSPRFLWLMIGVGLAPLVFLTLSNLLSPEDFSPVLLGLMVAFVLTWMFLVPLALRQRRRVRAFREAYDARHSESPSP